MDESIIIIDSEDEDCSKKEAKSKNQAETVSNGKRHNEISSNDNESPPVKLRRIQPLKIGEVTKIETSRSSQESDVQHKDSSCSIQTVDSKDSINDSNSETKKERHRNEVTKELEGLINACRKAENNNDMKKIIKTKLMKYYDLVHPDYAKSDHLCKMLENTALGILRDPKTVYSKLQDIINELKSRKNCGPVIIVQQSIEQPSVNSEENGSEEIQSTGDEKKDKQLKKLNKALTKLKNEIEDLEEAEVNLDDDDDSAYMKKVKYEKRAVEIYNKICDITGESSHAHRIGKQPIKFKNTRYQEFNRRLSKRINKENGFPSYYDVYRLLDVCNKEYHYGLSRDQIQNISQLAFVEVGKLLKERRCNDLYESAEHYAGKNKDPAKEDSELKAKLEKNKEFYSKRTEEILQLYVTKQINGEDDEELCEATTSKAAEDSVNTSQIESDSLKLEPDEITDTSRDLQSVPTEKITIDIKTECDIKDDEKKDSAGIDLTISL